jgi:hypothetical protein
MSCRFTVHGSVLVLVLDFGLLRVLGCFRANTNGTYGTGPRLRSPERRTVNRELRESPNRQPRVATPIEDEDDDENEDDLLTANPSFRAC